MRPDALSFYTRKDLALDFKFTIPYGIYPARCTFGGDENSRYPGASHLCLFKAGNKCLVAGTDGRTLCLINVEVDGEFESPVLLPLSCCGPGGKACAVEVRGGEVRTTSQWLKRYGEITFVDKLPDQKQRFPEIKSVMAIPNVVDFLPALTIDAGFLKQLASAISEKSSVTLFLPTAKDGIVDTPIAAVGYSDSLGLFACGMLVPMKVDARMIQKKRDFYRGTVDSLPERMFDVKKPTK